MEAILEKARKNAGEPKGSTRTKFSPHQLFAAAQATKKVSPTGVREILPEPQVLLTPSPKLPGLDGRKMSKSYKNHIMLSEPEADLRAKMKMMVTDPARVRREDPGNPDVCPVFDLHKVFSSETVQQEAALGCRTAGIGCIECKSWVSDAMVATIAPIQARRRDLEAKPDIVKDVLANGKERAILRAQQTLDESTEGDGLA